MGRRARRWPVGAHPRTDGVDHARVLPGRFRHRKGRSAVQPEDPAVQLHRLPTPAHICQRAGRHLCALPRVRRREREPRRDRLRNDRGSDAGESPLQECPQPAPAARHPGVPPRRLSLDPTAAEPWRARCRQRGGRLLLGQPAGAAWRHHRRCSQYPRGLWRRIRCAGRQRCDGRAGGAGPAQSRVPPIRYDRPGSHSGNGQPRARLGSHSGNGQPRALAAAATESRLTGAEPAAAAESRLAGTEPAADDAALTKPAAALAAAATATTPGFFCFGPPGAPPAALSAHLPRAAHRRAPTHASPPCQASITGPSGSR